MKNPLLLPALAAAGLLLGGCGGPVVRTVEVSAAPALGVKHPAILYALKRTRLTPELNLTLVQAMPALKLGDKWEPQRSKVTYRIDFAKADGVKVTPALEDDPALVFAIHTDSVESALTSIKNFEVKLQADGTLASINGQFEDTTLDVASDVVGIGLDLVKLAGNVALNVTKSTEQDRIDTTVLDSPVIRVTGSLVLKDFTTKAEHEYSYDLLPAFQAQLDAAVKQLERQHAALNDALRAEIRLKLKEAKKEGLDQITTDAGLLDAAGLSPTYLYPDKAVVENAPAGLTLTLTATGGTDLQAGSTLTATSVVAEAIMQHKTAGDTGTPEGFGGIFYRRAGRGTVAVTMPVKLPDNKVEDVALFRTGLALPEAGHIAYTNVDSRLFTNRNATVTFNSGGELSDYKLTANSAAAAATGKLAKLNKDIIGTLQEKAKQKETDEAKAKADAATAKAEAKAEAAAVKAEAATAKAEAAALETEAKQKLQDAANLKMRIMTQEDQIQLKQQAITAQERAVQLRTRDRDEAQAAFALVQADLSLTDDSEASQQKKAAAQQAKRELATAEDNLFTATTALDRLRYEKTRLEAQLEIIKAGQTISGG